MNDFDVHAHAWFHAIDLGGGLQSPGRFPKGVPPNYTLFGFFDLISHMNLSAATCVDVGTMDGISAFVMKGLGAQRVIATDLAPRPTFRYACQRLQLDIDYQVPVQAVDLPQHLGSHSVDVVLMAGVLYHVFDPLAVLVACRSALKRGGYLIAETTYLVGEDRPWMAFNPSDASSTGIELANVFWRPSRSALIGMLNLTGFEVIASVAADARLTILAQAKRPSELTDISPRIKNIHKKYMNYKNYKERIDFRALERDESSAKVSYHGAPGHRRIYRALFRPQVPYQPTWAPGRDLNALGISLQDTLRSSGFHARELAARAKARLRR